MNTKLLLIAVASVSLSSCSSVYKSGQTPDDVYYSPVRMYGAEEKKDDDRKDDNSKTYAEKSQIRLGINDSRWRYLDDFSYTPYAYGYNYGYYYNPYYCPWPVYNYGTIVTVNPKNSTPRMTNLAAYNTAYNNSNVNANSKYYNPVNFNSPVRSYNNSSKLSNTLNKLFNSGNYNNSNNSQNNSSQSSRSYTPSSSSRSSGSSSSGGGAVSRPVRNGKG